MTFTVLYMLFIYYVLIEGKVQVGVVFFDATTTNLLVSIFSQIFVILATATIHRLLLQIMLHFVIKDTSLVSLFAISFSSGWPSVLKLLSDHATFEYYFVPGPMEVPVFAGLIPLDNRAFEVVPIATLCLYMQGWTSSLLTSNNFATSFPMDGCDTGCRSLFLPGGLDLVRQVGPWLNQSMFEGGLLDNAETIRINNAPGIVTTYRNISDITFDWVVDCLYTGQSINDTLQMCIRQVDQSIAVGWAGCPQELYNSNSCNINRTWTTAPLQWATVMACYKQYATTTYNRENFSIMDVRPTADLEQILLNASDYMTIFKKIMIPTSAATETDRAGIESLIYTLTWLHRTYRGSFPDDQNSLVTNLHNFLAIPLQFTVTAYQYANYTAGGNFSLPEDTVTVATNGWSRSRLAIQPWTGWLFIIAAAALLLVVMAGILWILGQKAPLPPATGIGDFDDLRQA
ncbi:hypothetical protein L207DRAFT_454895, partial [Hyaloscypha variabilis F]